MLGGENNFFRWQRRDDNQLKIIQLTDAINPKTSPQQNLLFHLKKLFVAL